MYRGFAGEPARQLDAHVVSTQNDAVIAPPPEGQPAPESLTILIVDDDRSVADTFARILKLEGFGVATAFNADEGLGLAETVNPAAIILDMRMPITNGLQFLRMVRNLPHLVTTPVAIVTGDYFLPDPIQAELKQLGAEIRFKPLWLEDLIALARSLVNA
jgi:DNA-binding response OmpR family regulator